MNIEGDVTVDATVQIGWLTHAITEAERVRLMRNDPRLVGPKILKALAKTKRKILIEEYRKKVANATT